MKEARNLAELGGIESAAADPLSATATRCLRSARPLSWRGVDQKPKLGGGGSHLRHKRAGREWFPVRCHATQIIMTGVDFPIIKIPIARAIVN